MNDRSQPREGSKFANGGILPPGRKLAVNLSGLPIPVVQQGLMQRLAAAHEQSAQLVRAQFNQLAMAFRAIAPIYAKHLAEAKHREAVRRRCMWTETRRRTRTRTRSKR